MAGIREPYPRALLAHVAAFAILLAVGGMLPVRRVMAQATATMMESNYQAEYELALRRDGTPHLCNGKGKRYCGTAHKESSCPETCQLQNCAPRPPSHFNLIITEGRYDYVYIYDDQMCVSTCRDNPRRGVCAAKKGFWINSLFYCTNLDCSYTREGAVSGCHQPRDFFEPDCEVCTRVFPGGCTFTAPSRSPPPRALPNPPAPSPPAPPPPPPTVQWLTEAPAAQPVADVPPPAAPVPVSQPTQPSDTKQPEKPQDKPPAGAMPPVDIPTIKPVQIPESRDRFQLDNAQNKRAGRSAVDFQFRLQLNPAAYSSFDGTAQVLGSLVAEMSGSRPDQVQHVQIKPIVNGQIAESTTDVGLSPHLVSGVIYADSPLETAGNLQAAGFTGLLGRMLEVSGFMLRDNSLLVKVDLGNGETWTGADDYSLPNGGGQDGSQAQEDVAILDVTGPASGTDLGAASESKEGQSPLFIGLMVMFGLMVLVALGTLVAIAGWYCRRHASHNGISIYDWRLPLQHCQQAFRRHPQITTNGAAGLSSQARKTKIMQPPWMGVTNPLWETGDSSDSSSNANPKQEGSTVSGAAVDWSVGADRPDIPVSFQYQ